MKTPTIVFLALVLLSPYSFAVLARDTAASIAATDMLMPIGYTCCSEALANDPNLFNKVAPNSGECCQFTSDVSACNACIWNGQEGQRLSYERQRKARVFNQLLPFLVITSLIIIPLSLILLLINFIVKVRGGNQFLGRKLKILFWTLPLLILFLVLAIVFQDVL
jgi:hypothetical protein